MTLSLRLVALLAAIALGVAVVAGWTSPTDAEKALAGIQGLIALALVARDLGL